MRSLALSAVVAATAAAPAFAQDPADAVAMKATGEVRIADTSDRKNPPPISPISEAATLSAEAPDGLVVPDGVLAPQIGSFEIRNMKIHVVVGKSGAEDEVPDMLYIDLNGDGKLESSELLKLDSKAQDMRGQTLVRGRVPELKLTLGNVSVPAAFSYSRVGDRPARAALQFSGYLHATVKLGDQERIIAVVDKDLDGKFDGDKDLWTLATAGARPANLYALSAIDESVFEDGKRIGIAVSGNSVAVRLTPAAGPDPVDLASHRARVEHIWKERFDQEREGFIKARELDLSRPEAETPIAWKYMTFKEGLELSKQTGKPLFVDVMAFWCVWCYRLDYYTYPDKEVADLLNSSFIPMKLIQEQDPAGDYKVVSEKIEARGIPAMGIFDGDGKLLYKIGGWKKPEDFLAELQKVDTGR